MKFSITNLLLMVTIAALAISLTMALLAKDPMVTVVAEDNSYSFKFRQKLLKATPHWHESESNPPLSARDAMEIANGIAVDLNSASKQFNIGNWAYESLTFSHLNFGYRDMRTKNSSTKWCYIVHFRSLRSYQHDPEIASFMILMDGRVFIGENPWLNSELEKAMRLKI